MTSPQRRHETTAEYHARIKRTDLVISAYAEAFGPAGTGIVKLPFPSVSAELTVKVRRERSDAEKKAAAHENYERHKAFRKLPPDERARLLEAKQLAKAQRAATARDAERLAQEKRTARAERQRVKMERSLEKARRQALTPEERKAERRAWERTRYAKQQAAKRESEGATQSDTLPRPESTPE